MKENINQTNKKMKTLVTIVLTIDRNLHFGQQCIEHLKQNGFTDPILKIFPAAPPGSSLWKTHLSIMDNHYNIVRWFVDTYDSKTHDLMVCEDDCEFVFPTKNEHYDTKQTVCSFVHQQLETLHSEHAWFVYFLGHLAYGPMFCTAYERLSHTTLPATTHCYILNGERLREYVCWIPRWLWTAPFMGECWLCVRPWEKFAAFPSIATQNRQIKGLDKIPVLRNIPVIKFIRVLENMMHVVSFVILVGLAAYLL